VSVLAENGDELIASVLISLHWTACIYIYVHIYSTNAPLIDAREHTLPLIHIQDCWYSQKSISPPNISHKAHITNTDTRRLDKFVADETKEQAAVAV
jgi:hypothetical protein